MPFKIVRDDITHISADAIVNSANPHAVIGGGVDAAIHMAAGPRLIEARKKIGDIAEGDVRYSRAFDLLARYVFHAVGPDCRKPQPNMEEKLRNCYAKSLKLAKDLGCESIAFPMISTGIYDCPKDQAFQIAISTISDFLLTNDMEVTLVVYDSEAYGLSTKLFHDVKAYVDEHYVESIPRDAGISGLGSSDLRRSSYLPNSREGRAEAERRRQERGRSRKGQEQSLESMRQLLEDKGYPKPIDEFEITAAYIPVEEIKFSLDEDGHIKTIKPNGETFSEMLLRLIDHSGKTDAEIYRKADQTRQLFHKIRTNKDYQPSKNTVLSFALALELNTDQTMDLLKSAGYSLSDGIQLDVAFQYFFKNHIYNIFEIKGVLFEMGIEF